MSKEFNGIANIKKELQYLLDAHKINGKIVRSLNGPRVTRFCISLKKGVDVRKVERCSKDIMITLGVDNIRILNPIPGENSIGIEIPNGNNEKVCLSTLLDEQNWKKEMTLPIMLGKEISGEKVDIDLAKALHVLIAGNDPAEISMGLNAMAMSLVHNFTPDDLHLVLYHPQEDVFAGYQGPVIHDTRQIITDLRETAVELERRYKVLASAHAKTLKEYNDNVENQNSPQSSRLPYKIIIIGELEKLRKDKMWNEAEMDICRIAQIGRAAGIHLVAATQFPTSTVVTGLVKANLPTRIAFRVDNVNESRLILDMPGAENLLGDGDMLLMEHGIMKRIQCATI